VGNHSSPINVHKPCNPYAFSDCSNLNCRVWLEDCLLSILSKEVQDWSLLLEVKRQL
jgi:hypothetical protein